MFGNRRGELTSQQIAITIIAIAGFIVVLVFVAVLFDDSGEADREICRLSVLTRATAPTIAQGAVPLKCTTSKICVTDKTFGGKCKQFQGEENVATVRLKVKNNDEKKREMEKILADNMYYCWSMMGQGKLDLFGSFEGNFGLGSNDGKSTCVICSRVAFADDIVASGLNKEIRLTEYLQNNFVPLPGSNLKYIEAFTDRGTSTFPSVKEMTDLIEEGKGLEDKADKVLVDKYDQVAFVFAQNKPANWDNVLRNWGVAAVGSTFTSPGFLKKPLLFVEGVLAVGGTINAYEAQGAAAGYCGNFTTSVDEEKLRGGCSITQSVPYTVSNINALCDSIQSIP